MKIEVLICQKLLHLDFTPKVNRRMSSYFLCDFTCEKQACGWEELEW